MKYLEVQGIVFHCSLSASAQNKDENKYLVQSHQTKVLSQHVIKNLLHNSFLYL